MIMEIIDFSVIIPAYNCEKYISICLDSIIKNNYKNLEIIVINDGSTDTTPLIVKEYQKKHNNIYLYSQHNSGVSIARNTGIKYSKGKYIHFVDADDKVEDNLYRLAKSVFKSNDIDFLRFNYDFDNMGILKENNEKKQNNYQIIDEKYINNIMIPQILDEEIKAYVWQLIVKKEIIDYFDSRMVILEDVNFVINALKKAKKGYLCNETYYHYNISNLSSATKSPKRIVKMMKNMLESNEIIKQTLKINKLNSIENLEILDSRMCHSFINYFEQLFLIYHNYNKVVRVFKEGINNNELKIVFSNFRYTRLKISHRITTFLGLNKMYFLLYFLYLIKRRK